MPCSTGIEVATAVGRAPPRDTPLRAAVNAVAFGLGVAVAVGTANFRDPLAGRRVRDELESELRAKDVAECAGEVEASAGGNIGLQLLDRRGEPLEGPQENRVGRACHSPSQTPPAATKSCTPAWVEEGGRSHSRRGSSTNEFSVEAAEATPIVAWARQLSSRIEHGRAAFTLRRSPKASAPQQLLHT